MAKKICPSTKKFSAVSLTRYAIAALNRAQNCKLLYFYDCVLHENFALAAAASVLVTFQKVPPPPEQPPVLYVSFGGK